MIALLFASILLACSTGSPASSPYFADGYTRHTPAIVDNPDKIPVYVDKKFSTDHKADIRAAISEWNIVLNGYESLSIVSEDFDMEPAVLEQIEKSEQGLLVLRRGVEDSVGDGVLGWVRMPDEGGEAHALNLVEDVFGTRSVKTVALHELGHVLGVRHLPIQGSVMFPFYGRFQAACVDQATVQALASVRGGSWKTLNYCDRP